MAHLAGFLLSSLITIQMILKQRIESFCFSRLGQIPSFLSVFWALNVAQPASISLTLTYNHLPLHARRLFWLQGKSQNCHNSLWRSGSEWGCGEILPGLGWYTLLIPSVHNVLESVFLVKMFHVTASCWVNLPEAYTPVLLFLMVNWHC